MVCERINDGIDRCSKTWFLRHNRVKGAYVSGGARKSIELQTKTALFHLRAQWAGVCNASLAENGFSHIRIDHRSNEARGIGRPAKRHLFSEPANKESVAHKKWRMRRDFNNSIDEIASIDKEIAELESLLNSLEKSSGQHRVGIENVVATEQVKRVMVKSKPESALSRLIRGKPVKSEPERPSLTQVKGDSVKPECESALSRLIKGSQERQRPEFEAEAVSDRTFKKRRVEPAAKGSRQSDEQKDQEYPAPVPIREVKRDNKNMHADDGRDSLVGQEELSECTKTKKRRKRSKYWEQDNGLGM